MIGLTDAAALRETLKALGNRYQDLQDRIRFRLDSQKLDGGAGSGNWGHSGRPGMRGGSMPGGGAKNRYGSKESGFSNRARRGQLVKDCRDAMDTCKETMRRILYSNGGSSRKEVLKELRAEASSASVTAAKKRLQARQAELDKLQRFTGKQTKEELEEQVRKGERALEEYDRKNPDKADDTWGERGALKSELERSRRFLEAAKAVEAAELDFQMREKKAQMAKEQLAFLKNYDGEDSHELVQQYNRLAEDCYKKTLGAFRSASDCETTDDATAYLRAKKYYQDHGGNFVNDTAVDLSGMTSEHAVKTAKRLESLFTEYPMLKGKLAGILVQDLDDELYGQCEDTLVKLNSRKYGSRSGALEKSKRRDVAYGFHPSGTDETEVVVHETGHAIEKAIMKQPGASGERVADEVMRRVIERMNGSYRPNLESHYRSEVSGYAAHNEGTKGNDLYGRNTEFLAEAFAEYKTSRQPREVSRIAGEELEKIMKERL